MSIKFVDGDLLEDDAEILVNAVNCRGVMGAGIAKIFKKRYPKMFADYRDECKQGLLKPGRVYEYEVGQNKWVWNATTKYSYDQPSNYRYVENCIMYICSMLQERLNLDEPDMPSIAIPALGCGCGGLDWDWVKRLLINNLESVAYLCDIQVYNPR